MHLTWFNFQSSKFYEKDRTQYYLTLMNMDQFSDSANQRQFYPWTQEFESKWNIGLMHPAQAAHQFANSVNDGNDIIYPNRLARNSRNDFRSSSDWDLRPRDLNEVISRTQPPLPSSRQLFPSSVYAKADASVAAAVAPFPSTSTSLPLPAASSQNRKSADSVAVQYNTRCEMSEAILMYFQDIQQDQDRPTRHSAKCSLCNHDEPRKYFVKGNNSNLKSHLRRVTDS